MRFVLLGLLLVYGAGLRVASGAGLDFHESADVSPPQAESPISSRFAIAANSEKLPASRTSLPTGGGDDRPAAAAISSGNGTRSGVSPTYSLEPMDVLGMRMESGRSVIAAEELRTQPLRTDSITEALKSIANVQFSNSESSSLTMGEISPPRVSISGAKPYENNFLIDGTSVSNTLNPNGLDADGDSPGSSRLDVNGADQTLFYDTRLVDSVSVYSSNVPVKYGNFVGGVVDAQLADPRTDRWHGEVTSKLSRSEWFDLRGVSESSESSANQPRFDVYSLQTKADGPLSDNLALLLAATRKWSDIPLKFEARDGTQSEKTQHRSNENFLGKVTATPDKDLKISLDMTYAPYSEVRWNPSWEDSSWNVENNAWRLGSSAVYKTPIGDLTSRVAYSQNGYSRDSSSNFREQLQGSGVAVEDQFARGALGDAMVTNRGADASLDWQLRELRTGEFGWRIAFGASASTVATEMWNEAARLENKSVPSSNKWILIDAEYPEFEQSKSLNTWSGYIQPELVWKRLVLTPGLRIDCDDYSYNTNISPRMKAELDTMGDGALRLVAGASRYYGGQLRAYYFDRWRPSLTRMEMWNGSVTYNTGTDKSYLAKDLKTPYADELMSGILGEALSIEYGLDFVHRNYKDQIISKAAEKDIYSMTNDGESTYDGINIRLSRQFASGVYGNHKFSLGMTQSWTKTYNGAFDSEIDAYATSSGYPYSYDAVYYNGERVGRSDLPANNFAQPVVVTLAWQGSFIEDRLHVDCQSRWHDSHTGLVKDARIASETPYGTTASKPTSESSQWLNADGSYSDAYKKGILSGGLMTDVSLEWDAFKNDYATFSLLLDIYNLFASDADYLLHEGAVDRFRDYGRGYYAGVRCVF